MKLAEIYKYFEVQCFYDGLNIKKTEFKKYLKEVLDLNKLKKADEKELVNVYLGMFPIFFDKYNANINKSYKQVGVVTQDPRYRNGQYLLFLKFIFSSGEFAFYQAIEVKDDTIALDESRNTYDSKNPNMKKIQERFGVDYEGAKQLILRCFITFVKDKTPMFWKHYDKVIEENINKGPKEYKVWNI